MYSSRISGFCQKHQPNQPKARGLTQVKRPGGGRGRGAQGMHPASHREWALCLIASSLAGSPHVVVTSPPPEQDRETWFPEDPALGHVVQLGRHAPS